MLYELFLPVTPVLFVKKVSIDKWYFESPSFSYFIWFIQLKFTCQNALNQIYGNKLNQQNSLEGKLYWSALEIRYLQLWKMFPFRELIEMANSKIVIKFLYIASLQCEMKWHLTSIRFCLSDFEIGLFVVLSSILRSLKLQLIMWLETFSSIYLCFVLVSFLNLLYLVAVFYPICWFNDATCFLYQKSTFI